MLTWHERFPGSYECRAGRTVLGQAWYDTPLFFGKKNAKWKACTSFGGVNVRSFCDTYDTLEDAKAGMEAFLVKVANIVVDNQP